MPLRQLILACMLSMTGHGPAIAATPAWTGAGNRFETLPEPIVVNGVSFEIRSAHGSEAGTLASRMAEEWGNSRDQKFAKPETLGGWNMVSRILGNHLEVLQWRGTGPETQLLWSRSDLNARIQAGPDFLLPLPHGCAMGTSVHGTAGSRRYVQRSARCNGSPRSVLSTIEAEARRRGFPLRLQEGVLMTGDRNKDVLVLAWPSNDATGIVGTSVVYLQTGREGGSQ